MGIDIGSKVLVYVEETTQIPHNPLTKLSGQEFIVKRKRVITTRPSNKVYYELYGAKSDMGVPYSFVEDDLILIP